MNFSNNTKIRREIWDKEDDNNDLMIEGQESNDIAIHILTKYGHREELLKLTSKQPKEREVITKPNSK